ncbi:MAG: CBS domain-containing protein [Alphaproteobacteria bacterium]|jgi:CBS domain-containing protein|tara:strand:+ start:3491 stop:3946 length:456 start_codon:yes stop_codon:yes gene_type:complete
MIKDLSKIKSKKTCFSFTSESTVSEIADMMDLKDIGAVPIINQDNLLIGILSERDIVRKLVKTGRDSDLVTAHDIMTKEIKSVQLDTSIDEAQRIMTENNIRHLPVVDQNHKLINFLSQRDLILSPTKKINQILMIGIPLLILITVFIIIK